MVFLCTQAVFGLQAESFHNTQICFDICIIKQDNKQRYQKRCGQLPVNGFGKKQKQHNQKISGHNANRAVVRNIAGTHAHA